METVEKRVITFTAGNRMPGATPAAGRTTMRGWRQQQQQQRGYYTIPARLLLLLVLLLVILMEMDSIMPRLMRIMSSSSSLPGYQPYLGPLAPPSAFTGNSGIIWMRMVAAAATSLPAYGSSVEADFCDCGYGVVVSGGAGVVVTTSTTTTATSSSSGAAGAAPLGVVHTRPFHIDDDGKNSPDANANAVGVMLGCQCQCAAGYLLPHCKYTAEQSHVPMRLWVVANTSTRSSSSSSRNHKAIVADDILDGLCAAVLLQSTNGRESTQNTNGDITSSSSPPSSSSTAASAIAGALANCHTLSSLSAAPSSSTTTTTVLLSSSIRSQMSFRYALTPALLQGEGIEADNNNDSSNNNNSTTTTASSSSSIREFHLLQIVVTVPGWMAQLITAAVQQWQWGEESAEEREEAMGTPPCSGGLDLPYNYYSANDKDNGSPNSSSSSIGIDTTSYKLIGAASLAETRPPPLPYRNEWLRFYGRGNNSTSYGGLPGWSIGFPHVAWVAGTGMLVLVLFSIEKCSLFNTELHAAGGAVVAPLLSSSSYPQAAAAAAGSPWDRILQSTAQKRHSSSHGPTRRNPPPAGAGVPTTMPGRPAPHQIAPPPHRDGRGTGGGAGAPSSRAAPPSAPGRHPVLPAVGLSLRDRDPRGGSGHRRHRHLQPPLRVPQEEDIELADLTPGVVMEVA